MGFFSDGKALTWKDAKKLAQFIRDNGIEQFLNIYNAARDRKEDGALWGDELEYIVVKFDAARRLATLSLRAHEILPVLQEEEKQHPASFVVFFSFFPFFFFIFFFLLLFPPKALVSS